MQQVTWVTIDSLYVICTNTVDLQQKVVILPIACMIRCLGYNTKPVLWTDSQPCWHLLFLYYFFVLFFIKFLADSGLHNIDSFCFIPKRGSLPPRAIKSHIWPIDSEPLEDYLCNNSVSSSAMLDFVQGKLVSFGKLIFCFQTQLQDIVS